MIWRKYYFAASEESSGAYCLAWILRIFHRVTANRNRFLIIDAACNRIIDGFIFAPFSYFDACTKYLFSAIFIIFSISFLLVRHAKPCLTARLLINRRSIFMTIMFLKRMVVCDIMLTENNGIESEIIWIYTFIQAWHAYEKWLMRRASPAIIGR